MRRLARYLGRYRLRLGWGITCLIATTTLVMSIPWLQKRTVDAIAHDAGMRHVVGLVATIIGIALVQAVVRWGCGSGGFCEQRAEPSVSEPGLVAEAVDDGLSFAETQ